MKTIDINLKLEIDRLVNDYMECGIYRLKYIYEINQYLMCENKSESITEKYENGFINFREFSDLIFDDFIHTLTVLNSIVNNCYCVTDLTDKDNTDNTIYLGIVLAKIALNIYR